jgi:hypothetical protein
VPHLVKVLFSSAALNLVPVSSARLPDFRSPLKIFCLPQSSTLAVRSVLGQGATTGVDPGLGSLPPARFKLSFLLDLWCCRRQSVSLGISSLALVSVRNLVLFSAQFRIRSSGVACLS